MSLKVRDVELVDSQTGGSDRAGVDGCCRRGRRTSTPGREDQFATGGSGPWQDIVAEWLTLPRALPPTKVRFRGTPDSRPGDRPRSGVGGCSHWRANPDRPHPVSSGSSVEKGDRPLLAEPGYPERSAIRHFARGAQGPEAATYVRHQAALLARHGATPTYLRACSRLLRALE